MYITNTTEDVKKLVEELEATSDLTKLKFLVYIFGLLNNNQINDKNESNPDLIEAQFRGNRSYNKCLYHFITILCYAL